MLDDAHAVASDAALAVLARRLRLAAALVLIVGLCAAALVYVAAGDDGAGPAAGGETLILNGQTYEMAPLDSKAYLRDVERFGGKASVLFVQFEDWFSGLWHGRALAVTLAWITVALAGALFGASRLCARAEGSGARE